MADQLAKKPGSVTAETAALEPDRGTPLPTPPGVNEFQFTAAFMQKPDMFTTLSDELKGKLFDNMDKADVRQADHARAELISVEKLKLQAMADRKDGRKMVVRFCYVGGFGIFAMFFGVLLKGDTASAVELAKDGGIAIALLLGGVGAGAAVRKYFS